MEANLHEFPKASEKEIKLSEGSLEQQAKHSRLDKTNKVSIHELTARILKAYKFR